MLRSLVGFDFSCLLRRLLACAAALSFIAWTALAQAAITMNVATNSDCSSGSTCCLRLAVQAANTPNLTHAQNACVPSGKTSTGAGDIIQLGLANSKSIVLSSALGAITIKKSMTIQGNYSAAAPDNATVKITGTSAGTFVVDSSLAIDVTFKYLRITGGGNPDFNGGALQVYGLPYGTPIHVSMNTVQIDNCKGYFGGAIYLNGALDLIGDSSTDNTKTTYFHDNVAAYGGAVYHYNNAEAGFSGARYYLHVINAKFFKNYANQLWGGGGDGGALYLINDQIKVDHSTFGAASNGNKAGCGASCTATGRGGAIYMDQSGGGVGNQITNTTFAYNLAAANNGAVSGGGAIYTTDGLILSGDNTFSNNECRQLTTSSLCQGGALRSSFNSYLEIFKGENGTTFSNNTAGGTNAMGGAIYAAITNQSVTAPGVVFSGNVPADLPYASNCDIPDPYGNQVNGYCGHPAGRIGYCPDDPSTPNIDETGTVARCPVHCYEVPGTPDSCGDDW